MTSLERISCLVDHDICKSSVDDGFHGFRADKHSVSSFLFALSEL